MTQPGDTAIEPTPSDEEAAAIIAALTAHLTATRSSTTDSQSRPSAWALAGRLASQGQPIARIPGTQPSWANAARLERTRRES